MVIGTYRPVDVILSDHPLKSVKRELQAHGLCQELALEYLTGEAVAQYLDARFPGHRLPKRLGRLIHRRSEGNPLFMVNLVDFLVDEGTIDRREEGRLMLGDLAEIESSVPDSIKQLIERQIERLSPDERRVLAGASVVGMECSSTAIAAGLDQQIAWVDEQCEALVRRHQFLSPPRLVELPDGTMTSRYKFSHVLYLDVPYGLLPPMRRAQIHGRIGQSGEAIYGDRVGEIAAELAMHFEQARDMPRAVKYLLQAAENARHRSAQHEAAALASRGLRALATLPDTPTRAQQELNLRVILGVSLMAIKGFAAAEVEDIYQRARALCAEQGASTQSFTVHWLLGLFHYFRAEMQQAHEIARQLLAMAADLGDPFVVIEANRAVGVTLVDLGRFDEALTHLDTVSALYETASYRVQASFAGQDPKVVSECFAARALWALGDPDRAMERLGRGLSLADALSHVESQVVATYFAAHLHQLRGEPSQTQERAETVIALADEYGLELWLAFGHIHRGWALAEQGQVDEGIQELRRGLADYEATGARLWRAHFLGLLAQAFGRAGRIEEGLTAAADALTLVQQTGENFSTAELYRLQGELLALRAADGNKSVAPKARESFERALSIARTQRATSWERRTDTSLARVRDRQG
jgi:predicted ATPase